MKLPPGMTTFRHFGLFFTPEHVQSARRYRDREPFHSAWAYLLDHDVPSGTLAAIQWNGLHYRFNDDSRAGEEAVVTLLNGVGLDIDLEDQSHYFEALTLSVTLAQCFEMTRDHPAFLHESQAGWLSQFAAQVDLLNRVPDGISLVNQLWLGLLNIAAGIVLEAETRLQVGAVVYQQTIRDGVRPEGYLPAAVDGNDGGSLWREMQAVGALVLMAEAASHIGVDLWGYTSRGVSILTAASYLIYYYYYPDQWRWDTISEDDSTPIFREQGGFLEILNFHTHPKDINLLLENLRPFYNVAGGGLTTLSHGVVTRRGLFG